MPLSKLQQALKAQQSQAAIASAKKKSAENSQKKEASLKHTAKEKKVLKRARQAGRPEPIDEPVVIDPETMLKESEEAEAASMPSKKKKGKGKSVNPNQLPVVPFDKTDTILLLGEANFSYTLSLLSGSHSHPAHQILATSYDTERECYLKYPDGEANVGKLRGNGVKVEFKVDAGNLEKCKAVGKGRWSKVIFNFPHAGAGITDQDRNILTNQHLLLRTLRSVAPVLTTGPIVESQSNGSKRKRPSSDDEDEEDENEEDAGDGVSDIEPSDIEDLDDEMDDKAKPAPTIKLSPPNRQGSILFTLLNQPPYTLWSLPQLAQRPPPNCPGTRLPQPRYTLLRSFRFHPDLYPGYAHRRTIGWKEGKSKSDNEEILGRQGEARTWEFVRYEPKEKGKGKSKRAKQ